MTESVDAPLPNESSSSARPARSLDQLAAVCYAELLAIAKRERRRLHNAATLDTSAVLHEAFLRMVAQRQTAWEDRTQFLAAAAGAMRRVLVDHVRRRRAVKRGLGVHPITLDPALMPAIEREHALIDLDDALTELAGFAPRLASVVECRYFGGMTEVETAQALDVTERTVRRDWIKARGWLQRALSNAGPHTPCHAR